MRARVNLTKTRSQSWFPYRENARESWWSQRKKHLVVTVIASKQTARGNGNMQRRSIRHIYADESKKLDTKFVSRRNFLKHGLIFILKNTCDVPCKYAQFCLPIAIRLHPEGIALNPSINCTTPLLGFNLVGPPGLHHLLWTNFSGMGQISINVKSIPIRGSLESFRRMPYYPLPLRIPSPGCPNTAQNIIPLSTPATSSYVFRSLPPHNPSFRVFYSPCIRVFLVIHQNYLNENRRTPLC